MELIDKIRAGDKAKRSIEWPDKGGANVDIRVCNEQDNLEATLEADKMFSGTKIGVENLSDYQAEKETQLLFRTMLDPDTGKKLFKSIAEFRSMLTPELKDYFQTAVDALHDEFSPDPASISEEDFDRLVVSVKKNPEEELTMLSDINLLKRLVLFLVSQQSS